MAAPKRADAKTKAWVDRKLTQEINESRNRNQLILGLRKQRLMRLKPRPPEAYQQYLGEGIRVPISFRLVETVIGSVAGNEGPEFYVSSPDAELAQRAAIWCRLMFDQQHNVGQSALYYRYWDGLIGDGLVGLKTLRRPWTDFPAREEGEKDEAYNDRVEEYIRARPKVPFRTRVVDAGTLFPPRSEWGPIYCIESGMRPTEEVFRQLGLQPKASGNIVVAKTADEPTPVGMPGLRMGPRVQVDELWTENELYVRVAGHVFEYENELGRLPYLWTSGAAMAFSDPTLQAMSVLYPLQYLEPWVNQFLSTLVGNATASAAPIAVATQQVSGTPGGAGDVEITDIPYGKQLTLPPGADLKFVNVPIEQQSIALLNTMIQLAERFTLSPIPQFAGTRTPGVVLSAIAERILAVLKPRIDQARRTWAEQFKMYLDLTQRVVGAPVAVSGLVVEERSGRSRLAETVITPRDVRKISDVIVEVKFRTIQDQIAWDTHNVLMMQAGVWSRERTRRESGVRDPQGEGKQIALEALLANPVIQAYVQTQALAGEPPLAALQELIQSAQQEGGFGSEAVRGLLGEGEGGGEQATRPEGGRLPGEARAPGGTGNAGAAALVQR